MNNKQKLVNVFAEALDIDKSLVIDTLAYQSIEQWDSVAHMILITQLEEAFDISIDTDDVIDLSSVSKAVEILSKYNIDFNA